MIYKIKFSHEYLKFPRPLPIRCILIQCIKVNYKELSHQFIEYDTSYMKDGEKRYYQLPKSDLIVLLLSLFEQGHPTIVFEEKLTTIRRYTPQKWDFYKSLEGEIVKLILSEKNEKLKKKAHNSE